MVKSPHYFNFTRSSRISWRAGSAGTSSAYFLASGQCWHVQCVFPSEPAVLARPARISWRADSSSTSSARLRGTRDRLCRYTRTHTGPCARCRLLPAACGSCCTGRELSSGWLSQTTEPVYTWTRGASSTLNRADFLFVWVSLC